MSLPVSLVNPHQNWIR